jgi:4'-phosphopantetheinyl transferase
VRFDDSGCELWRLPLAPGSEVPAQLWPVLPVAEQAHAGRLRVQADRVAYVAAHALLRLRLQAVVGVAAADLRFGHGAWGKPALAGPGPAFNLSHCRSMVCVAFSTHGEVGVDVEPLDRAMEMDVQAVAQSVFTAAELGQLAACTPSVPQAFMRLWTLKEAVVKATGLGLSQDLKSFSVSLQGDVPVVAFEGGARSCADASLQLRQWQLEAHVLALARCGREPLTAQHHVLDLAQLAQWAGPGRAGVRP